MHAKKANTLNVMYLT